MFLLIETTRDAFMKKRDLVSVFAQITEPDEMNRFFDEIFTPTERRDLELRWKLMGMLKQGETQRGIAQKLGVSLCKITRGASILKDHDSVSNRLLEGR